MSSASASSTVPVHLDVGSRAGRYGVEIAPGLSAALATLLDSAGAPARRIIVSNPTVWRLHGAAFGAVSADEPILIPDGERFKTLQTTSRIYDGLLRLGASRSTALIALGGGVVGDTAGFAAATFLRGIPLVQVPTTLLAQVDSAIGGKVGVNHAAGKNLIGAFHPPAIVAVDPQLLVTLPRREFRAGLYEVVKYGIIASRPLFDRVASTLTALFARDPAALMPVIGESCAIKAAIVERDEHETGPRRALNFGHTAGHALEAITKYRRFRHGEAVAYGMLAAAAVAVARGAMRDEDRRAVATLIAQMGPLPPIADLSAGAVVEATRRDKKIVDGRLHFVLATAIGRTERVTDVSESDLAAALREIGLRA